MASIKRIEGISKAAADKLAAAGVLTSEALLKAGGDPKGRKELEDKTGLDGKQLLRWVNMADLFRITGIGVQYADLLEAAGVDTVPELAQRNAANLHAKMRQVNDAGKLVKVLPAVGNVEDWVAQAKSLERAIQY